MMNIDWGIFWNAFGAIGTTVGSVTTAIAVVVAVIQYKQPLIKKVKITFNTAFPIFDFELGENYYAVTLANTGVRQINITNIYLNAGKKNLVVNNIMTDLGTSNQGIDFPKELQPESSFTIYISCLKLAEYFRELLHRKEIAANQKIRILATDTTEGKHFHKTKLTAENIIKNLI